MEASSELLNHNANDQNQNFSWIRSDIVSNIINKACSGSKSKDYYFRTSPKFKSTAYSDNLKMNLDSLGSSPSQQMSARNPFTSIIKLNGCENVNCEINDLVDSQSEEIVLSVIEESIKEDEIENEIESKAPSLLQYKYQSHSLQSQDAFQDNNGKLTPHNVFARARSSSKKKPSFDINEGMVELCHERVANKNKMALQRVDDDITPEVGSKKSSNPFSRSSPNFHLENCVMKELK